jgi:hypothetical protein
VSTPLVRRANYSGKYQWSKQKQKKKKCDNWIDSYRNVSEKEINVSRRTNKIFKDTQRALFYGDGDENIINGDGRLKSE